jgi:hypothetical protein
MTKAEALEAFSLVETEINLRHAAEIESLKQQLICKEQDLEIERRLTKEIRDYLMGKVIMLEMELRMAKGQL